METGAKIATQTSKHLISDITEGRLSTFSSVLLEEANNQETTSGQGFPSAALDAANANGLTKANQPATANSLGLNVE